MKKRTKVIIAVGAIMLLLGVGLISATIVPIVDPPFGTIFSINL